MRRLAFTLGCVFVWISATVAAPVGDWAVEPWTFTLGLLLMSLGYPARPALCSRGRSQWARRKGEGE